MFIEQARMIRAYFRIADLSPWLFALNLLTAAAYKIFDTARPFVAAMIIKCLTGQDAKSTYLFIAIYAGVSLLYRLSLFLNWRSYSWNVIHCYQRLQDKIFKKLLMVDHDFTRKVNRGRLLNVINSDLFEIGEMNDEISEFITTSIQILAVFIISFTYSPSVAIIMGISAIVYSRVRTVHDRKFNFFWWKSQIENDRFSNFLNQILTGLQEVKAFNMLSQLHGHLSRLQKRYDRSYSAQRRHMATRDNDVKYVIYSFRAFILFTCIISMMNGIMELDILVLLYSYHQQIINNTKDFTDASVAIRLTNAAVRRVTTILNYHPGQKLQFGNLNLDRISGAIEFKNVSLTINHHQILRNLNFKIKPHEFIAIVGYPGSGKTKLFDLLLRLNKPTKGKIYLDKININQFSREVYTSNVAVANQVPFIFNTTIRNNLNFIDTNIKHQIDACKTAGIHDYIEALPLGYNTILRENGGNISGGQRQMISIARTILTDAEIFLLDDVTTSLDPDTAKLVPDLVSRIKKNRTVIMITKKPELMKLADRIIVLDRGKIADIGTHEKLLERNNLYRSLQTMRSPSLERTEEGRIA